MPEAGFSLSMEIYGIKMAEQKLDQLQRDLQWPRMERDFENALRAVAAEAQRLAPVATGNLRRSIGYEIGVTQTAIRGLVGADAHYAPHVEFGTRPHWPPVQALIPWVEMKLGIPTPESHSVAFLVARKISRFGTKSQPFLRQAVERKQRLAMRIIQDALRSIILMDVK